MRISNQETTFGREEYGCLNVYGASKIENAMCNLSGRFRGGAQGVWSPLFWVKKGNHRRKKSQQDKQNQTNPPPPLGKGLALPQVTGLAVLSTV